MLLGIGLSLIIESVQLLTKRGTFDVDDLIMNTLGALVGYFLSAAQTAFLSRDSTMDKICVAILACLVTIILPAMLYFYLKTRIRSRFFSPLLYIALLYLLLKGTIIYLGIPNMSYEFIYGKLFQ